jgi:hypothetical protein
VNAIEKQLSRAFQIGNDLLVYGRSKNLPGNEMQHFTGFNQFLMSS